MRRALFLIPLLVLGLLAWLVFWGGGGEGPDDAANPNATEQLDETEQADRERVRSNEQEARRRRSDRPPGNAFQQQFVELGQDVPQDPALGAIRGRVMITRWLPAGGGVLEASASGRLLARVHVPASGAFLLKNVPPGSGYALVARHDGHGPGGMDRIGVGAGETVDVGTVYVGAAIGPDVDNRVRVVVLDENAAPITGAEVTATTVFYGALLTLGQMEKQPGGTVLRKTTDASGEALFEMLPPAAYDIFAVADGYSFQVRQRLTVQRDTKARHELRLQPGLTISGKVVTAEGGEPIPGARVGGLRWNEFTSVPAVDCDAEGRFVLKGVRGGQPYFVFAMAAEVGGKEMQNIQAGTEDLLIEIPAGGDARLRVVDATTKEPLPEFMLRPFQNVPFAYMYAPAIEAKPEPDGTFVVRMSSAEYGMEVSADGYALETLPRVKIPSPEIVEVELQPAGVVRGWVRSKVDGKAVVGADVFVKKGGFPPSKVKDLVTTTDIEGKFVLDCLPPRTLSLWISHVDHTEQLFEGIEPEVTEEGVPPIISEFELGSGGRIEGHVFDDDRLPMVGQTIVLSAGFDFMSARNAMTDAEGAFVFKNVPLGKQYTVSVGAFVPGRSGRSKSGVTVSEGGVTTVDFGKETGGVAVTGTVLRSGEPVANAQVSILSDDGGDALVQERTDAAGSFTFPAVQPGKYQITVNRRGNVSTAVTVGEEPPPAITIELPTAEIAGVVVDSDGAPVSGAYVECERIGTGGASNLSRLSQAWAGNAVTADDGAFRIRGLSDDTYRVRAQAGGYGTVISEDVVIQEGATVTGLRLRLAAACTVTGFVRNAAGVPVTGASLTILDSQGRRLTIVDLSQSSSDGSFTAAQLAPGTYTMTFEKDGYAPASRTLNVTQGKVVETEFTLFQGGKIELTLRTPSEEPVSGAVVVVLDAAGEPIPKSFTLENMFSTKTIQTDASGRVSIPGLAPGRYRVRATKGAAVSTSETIDVFEGGSTALDMQVLGEGDE